MPRRAIDLESWLPAIQSWHAEGLTQSAMLEKLDSAGIIISSRTFKTRLNQWGLISYKRPTIDATEAIQGRIHESFHNQQVKDSELLKMLQVDGYSSIGLRAIGRLRRDLGLYKRIPQEDLEQYKQHVAEAIRTEFDRGRIESFGRKHLGTYMRQNHGLIGRDLIHDIAKEIYPNAVATRLRKNKERRGAILVPGPNYAWSIDAHCKFEHWGIQIYAAIDVFSRYVVWHYVGITGCTAISVVAQYATTLIEGGVMPRVIKSDRGKETTRAANAHHHFRQLLHSRDNESAPPLQFTDCFRYGTSKENQRIEAWWNQQTTSAAGVWRSYFQELTSTHEYIADNITDRIAFKAIYVPIMRTELKSFVRTWHAHKIRKQKNRPHVKHGVPSIMYQYPELHDGVDCGIVIDPEDVRPLYDRCAGLFDLEEYLPPNMIAWCNSTLDSGGFASSDLDGLQSNEEGQKLHRLAYMHLRDAARFHHAEHSEPLLHESIIPYADQWEPSNELQDLYRDAAETLEY